MKNRDIVIIGAGAAGLMAARSLAEKGHKITILEARHYIGGRIHTFYDESFGMPVELGAEFVHGDLPVTQALLKEAGITYHKTGGEWWQMKDGKLSQERQIIEHWDLFEEELKKLKEDMSLNGFLQQSFSDDRYAGMRTSARRYAAGFDTADPDTVSVFALRDEWFSEEEEHNYRPDAGYRQMIDFMEAKCRELGCDIHTGAAVNEIKWEENKVTVGTADGKIYTAGKAVITIPVGVLQATAGSEGAIAISPQVPHITSAISKLGMGAIIKVLFRFKEAIWENKELMKDSGEDLSDLGFLLSQETIPTWWTQFPKHSTLLTGWLGGPAARELKDATDEDLYEKAVWSLVSIFKLPATTIKDYIAAWKIVNWTSDSFSRGSYTFTTVAAKEAIEVLMKGISNTIFFAGEGLYEGVAMGTVEAALTSGIAVAKSIG